MALFDDSNSLIQYNGSGWSDSTSFPTNRVGSTTKTYIDPTSDVSITFYFVGGSLKIYGAGYSGMDTYNKITIDGIDYNMNKWSSITNNTIGVSFEKSDMVYGIHKATIAYGNSTRIYLDGIECDELISKDEYIKRLNNGSALIDIVPIMTSNLTPIDYSVTASSILNIGTDAWKAFNNSNNNDTDCWHSASGNSQWIQILLPQATRLSIVDVTSRNSASVFLYPIQKIEILGSNDGSSYTTIHKETFNGWNVNETKIINTDNTEFFRIYKFNITATGGYVAVGDIKIWGVKTASDDADFNISHKNASLAYSLLMSTTQKIKAKINDFRVGLLGMANDDENFGDLYVVGKDGKAHLTKSGIKSEVIFDGRIISAGDYNITTPLENFKIIAFEMENTTDAGRLSFNTTYVTNDLLEKKEFLLYEHGSRYVKLELKDDDYMLGVTAISSLYIRKVIGIY